MAKENLTGRAELDVRGVPVTMKTELKNLCKNMGITVSAHVKRLIREDLKQHPEYMKQERA